MQAHPIHHRRRKDPAVTIIHGATVDCPDVQAGRTSRCRGHTSIADVMPTLVPAERPIEHLRNALQPVRALLDFCEPVVADGESGLIVPIGGLDAIQRRIEVAIGLLELDGAACCLTCGGTILAPTIGGVPRGTCHCPANLHRGLASDLAEDR